MKPEDSDRFKSAIYGTFEVYSPKKVSNQLMDIWWATLKQYPIDDVCAALAKHIGDPDRGQFPPKPADIVRFFTGTSEEQQEQIENNAEMQWLTVMNAISRCGSYNTPNFKDPVTAASVNALGGWPLLCSKTEKELGYLQKSFVGNYKEFQRRPLDQLPSHIAGLEDMQKYKAEQQNGLANIAKGLEDYRSRRSA